MTYNHTVIQIKANIHLHCTQNELNDGIHLLNVHGGWHTKKCVCVYVCDWNAAVVTLIKALHARLNRDETSTDMTDKQFILKHFFVLFYVLS